MAYEPQFELGWLLPSQLLQKICRYEEWLLFSDITIGGEYKAAADILWKSPKKEVTFLDLGANVGFASWIFADALIRTGHKFKALLVEPNPDTFNELQARIKDQKKALGQNIIVPIQGLVGRRKGKALLRIDGCHTISRAFSTKAPEGGFYLSDIPYIDIEDYLDNEYIDLIKCDVEGSEFEFVQNYPELLARTGAVVMEIHEICGDPELIKTAMTKAGLTQHATLRVEGNVSTQMFSRPPLATYPSASPTGRRPFQNSK